MTHIKPNASRNLDILRTHLANERTLLAYFRTTLALLIVGGTILKFFDRGPIHIIAYVSIGLSVIALAGGVYSYERTRAIIKANTPTEE